MKKQIKLTEQELKSLIRESVEKFLREDYYGDPDDRQDEDLSGELDIQLSSRDLAAFSNAIPEGRALANRLSRGLSIRVYYSSYGGNDADIHNVRITDRNVRGILSHQEMNELEEYFLEYGKEGGFNGYIFGDVNDDFEGYEEFGEGPVQGNYDDHESDIPSSDDRRDDFIGGGY